MENHKFKETEIGKIPEDWEFKNWGDLATLEYGKALNNYTEAVDKYPVFGTNGQIGWSDKFLCQNAGIIIGRKGAYRGVHYSNKAFFVIDTAYYLKPKINFDIKWAYYELLTHDINSLDSGSAIPSTSRDDFYNLNVIVPPLKEQTAIAKILSDLDTKIELDHTMNATLEKIAETIFRYWFVDFEFPNEEGKPYKSSGGKMIESELGGIPEGWETDLLIKHVSFNRGCSYTSEGLKDSENALVTLKSIERGGGFKADGFKPYTGDYKRQHIVRNGDIVVAHTDLTQNAEVLGKPALVREVPRFKTLIASMDLGIVKPINNTISNSYLYYLLKTEIFQNHAYGYASGTTVLHLSSKAIPEFRFILPPKELVNYFSKVVDALTVKIRQNSSELERLELIRDSLLPKLMSGQIRIPLEART